MAKYKFGDTLTNVWETQDIPAGSVTFTITEVLESTQQYKCLSSTDNSTSLWSFSEIENPNNWKLITSDKPFPWVWVGIGAIGLMIYLFDQK